MDTTKAYADVIKSITDSIEFSNYLATLPQDETIEITVGELKYLHDMCTKFFIELNSEDETFVNIINGLTKEA